MKIAIAVLLLAGMAVLTANTVLAAGDKVRGDGAEGPAYQLGEVPFIG